VARAAGDTEREGSGVVLVHGGGGTAYKEWVRKWNEQGFAAIAMGLEGQTDERMPDAPREAQWKRHAWAGPARKGIYADLAEPLADQWMYHAVADVVLAHSLLRAHPEVDAGKIGVCGISWGGVITSTVVGIDSRFAFGIPIYGCGAVDRAPNQWGRALKDQNFYREVWEPLQRMSRARLPMLWLTGPNDQHFPLEVQQASYRAAPGPRMVSVPVDMKHSHPAGWNPPDSYVFARAVVDNGRPWARELAQEQRGGEVSVTFALTRPLQSAALVYRRETEWEQTPAKVEATTDGARLVAALPAGAKAWFFNGSVDGLTLSSELRTATPVSAPRTVNFPGFSWIACR
jgi:dienelactone hydrolase